MEAVAGIAERIWQIQSRIAQLSPPVAAPLGTLAPAAAGATGLTATGATTASAAAFSTVLGAAVAGMPGAAASSSSGLSPGSGLGAVDAKGIPLELARYGNGRIPASALATIDGTNHRLWTPAARSFEAMRAAAAADGVTIGITDSYRTYESQVDLARRKGLYSQGGLAAVPGTSEHGWGMAMDLKLDSSAQAWMRQNAGRFGFVEDVPREPWHWAYNPTH